MSPHNTPPHLPLSVTWHPNSPHEWVLQIGSTIEVYSSRGAALVRADDFRHGSNTPGIARDLLRKSARST
jgi:hypothetical protein